MTSSARRPRPAPRPHPAQRAWLWSGLCLVAVGLVAVGYVAWQLWGTNWVSHRRQQADVAAIRRAWDRPGHARALATHGGSRPAPEGALLRIPRFGSSYEMPILDGTSDDVLAQGVGHYSGTSGPGSVGNYALAAHRVTHGEPFRHLPDLRPGDKVVVETRAAILTYVLDTDPRRLVVPRTATWVVARRPVDPDPDGVAPAAGQRRLITLTTCSELFHTDNRMVAFGHLLTVVAKH